MCWLHSTSTLATVALQESRYILVFAKGGPKSSLTCRPFLHQPFQLLFIIINIIIIMIITIIIIIIIIITTTTKTTIMTLLEHFHYNSGLMCLIGPRGETLLLVALHL